MFGIPRRIEGALGAQAWLGRRAVHALDRLAAPAEARSQREPVSVVIAATGSVPIDRLLDSIGYAPGEGDEVIVATVGASHEAASRGRPGVRIVEAGIAPSGWSASSWGRQVGAKTARNAWILFLDERLVVESGDLAGVLLATAGDDAAVAVTAFPRYESVTLAEQVLVPFACRHLMAGSGSAHDVAASCMLMSRAAFETIGGYEEVAGEPAEHPALERELEKRGMRHETVDGRALVALHETEPAAFAARSAGMSAAAAPEAPGAAALAFSSAALSAMPALALLQGLRTRRLKLILTAGAAWAAEAWIAREFASKLSGRRASHTAAFLQPVALGWVLGMVVRNRATDGRSPRRRHGPSSSA